MTVLVSYNPPRGRRQNPWQVSRTQTGSVMNPFGADIVGNYSTREKAVSKARQAARDGEQIRAIGKNGNETIVRDGWTSR